MQNKVALLTPRCTFQRKDIQPGVLFDRVKVESKGMGEVDQKAGSDIMEAPAYYAVWRQALIQSWQSCCPPSQSVEVVFEKTFALIGFGLPIKWELDGRIWNCAFPKSVW
jgi:hypothetical protein